MSDIFGFATPWEKSVAKSRRSLEARPKRKSELAKIREETELSRAKTKLAKAKKREKKARRRKLKFYKYPFM